MSQTVKTETGWWLLKNGEAVYIRWDSDWGCWMSNHSVVYTANGKAPHYPNANLHMLLPIPSCSIKASAGGQMQITVSLPKCEGLTHEFRAKWAEAVLRDALDLHQMECEQ